MANLTMKMYKTRKVMTNTCKNKMIINLNSINILKIKYLF